MSSEWHECTLGDIITLQRGMDLPHQDRKIGIVPIVASNGVIGYHNIAPVKGPGVLIGRSGSIGGGQYIKNDFWPLNTTLWVKDFKGNIPLYCYYLLRSIDFSGLNAGSGVPTLNRNHLHPMPLSCPPVSEQIEIASILGSLDDRIFLLRETNNTLESIAQALFKSWFVDFDPVHAKQQGREPEGMDDATAALFPDSFEESELGVVPNEWRVGKLGELTSVKGGFAYKASSFCEVGSPVVKIKNIVGDGTVNLIDTVCIPAEIAENTRKFALKDGDIIIAMTGATIGKTGIVVTDDHLTPYLNQRVAKFDSNPLGQNNLWFVFVAFQNSFLFDQIVNTASGSAQPNISTIGIESARLVIPSEQKLLQIFNEKASILFKGWINNHKQIQTLAALRDTLLPRLISGQLRLPEAVTMLEEACA